MDISRSGPKCSGHYYKHWLKYIRTDQIRKNVHHTSAPLFIYQRNIGTLQFNLQLSIVFWRRKNSDTKIMRSNKSCSPFTLVANTIEDNFLIQEVITPDLANMSLSREMHMVEKVQLD